MQLPLLRGRLLDGAKALARDAETAKAAAEREALQLRQVLTDERWKAAAQASVLKAEVEALAGQLAQRAVLYAAQERRWKADERDMGRINMSAVRSSSKVLQPCR
jgi:histone H3/H4